MIKTGRFRFRTQKRLFKEELVVLQLEWEYTSPLYKGAYIQSLPHRAWRDATIEDLTEAQSLYGC